MIHQVKLAFFKILDLIPRHQWMKLRLVSRGWKSGVDSRVSWLRVFNPREFTFNPTAPITDDEEKQWQLANYLLSIQNGYYTDSVLQELVEVSLPLSLIKDSFRRLLKLGITLTSSEMKTLAEFFSKHEAGVVSLKLSSPSIPEALDVSKLLGQCGVFNGLSSLDLKHFGHSVAKQVFSVDAAPILKNVTRLKLPPYSNRNALIQDLYVIKVCHGLIELELSETASKWDMVALEDLSSLILELGSLEFLSIPMNWCPSFRGFFIETEQLKTLKLKDGNDFTEPGFFLGIKPLENVEIGYLPTLTLSNFLASSFGYRYLRRLKTMRVDFIRSQDFGPGILFGINHFLPHLKTVSLGFVPNSPGELEDKLYPCETRYIPIGILAPIESLSITYHNRRPSPATVIIEFSCSQILQSSLKQFHLGISEERAFPAQTVAGTVEIINLSSGLLSGCTALEKLTTSNINGKCYESGLNSTLEVLDSIREDFLPSLKIMNVS